MFTYFWQITIAAPHRTGAGARQLVRQLEREKYGQKNRPSTEADLSESISSKLAL